MDIHIVYYTIVRKILIMPVTIMLHSALFLSSFIFNILPIVTSIHLLTL
jgi:hypothetical protein